MNLQRTKQELQSNQAKTSLQHISSTGIYKPTNEEAWAGTNILTITSTPPRRDAGGSRDDDQQDS